MSLGGSRGQSREERLELEVRELRAELRRLTVRVDQQSEQLSDLSDSFAEQLSVASIDRGDLLASPDLRRRSEPVEESVSSYTVVESVSHREPEGQTNPRLSVVASAPSWSLREEVAAQIGGFLRRALRGEKRGPSGRERLRGLASNFYIVVRTYTGETFQHPVRVFTRFHLVKALCYRSGTWGNSIFVGVPTEREGEIAVSEAGLGWPSSFDQ